MIQLPSDTPAIFKGRHFNYILIIQAVWWYITFKLSYRDICSLMARARGDSRAYHRYAMGPALHPCLREKVEEVCSSCRLILASRRDLYQSQREVALSLSCSRQAGPDSRFPTERASR